jgi:uncharacterized Fe-S cluster-containing protein
MDTIKEEQNTSFNALPKLDCGACGYKSCKDFANEVDNGNEKLNKCIHIADKVDNNNGSKECFICAKEGTGMGDKLDWKDNLKRDFDFILDCFPNEPGPKETILPYNPTLVKDLGVKKGDVMIGRPMGMSCGCPITHCGVVSGVDARNGVIYWNVTGPLRPRTEGFVDIGFYVSQAYEGIIKETREKIELGRRYWFLPRRCMLQWRHSGLVNAVTKLPDGSYKVRIEGLLIG